MKHTIITVLAMSLFGFFAKADPLAVGAAAPKLTATNQDGQPLNFADIYAKGITLVYFYPKADSPGCTKQACSLRDNYTDLTSKGIQVIGVSEDSVAAQKHFENKFSLPFPLVADADHKVAKAFGVEMIPVVGVTKRQSFIVKDGKVAWVDLKVNPVGHADEVRAAVKSLQ